MCHNVDWQSQSFPIEQFIIHFALSLSALHWAPFCLSTPKINRLNVWIKPFFLLMPESGIKAEMCNFFATSINKLDCKNNGCFQKAFPNILSLCHWSNKQTVPPKMSAIGWANVAVVGLIGMLKHTEPHCVHTFLGNKPTSDWLVVLSAY